MAFVGARHVEVYTHVLGVKLLGDNNHLLCSRQFAHLYRATCLKLRAI
jgi:hypothetical protein